MGKKRKNKKRQRTESSDVEEPNPLGQKQREFLESLSHNERNSFFDDSVVSPTRRAELWMQQADLGETAVNQYAWATPNEKAMRIIKHFQPIVEVGCGANAYWCRQMKTAGIDVIGYDIQPDKGGIISHQGSPKQSNFKVRAGGPEVLSQKENKRRTLFLCYPDENDGIDDGESMGSSCLQHYTGDIVIHVGELFTDTTLSIDQAPWGRSSSPEFQQRLSAEYHCLLKVSLPNWLHTSDTLSVWKRSKTCTIVFAADGEGGDDEDEEEVKYRHVPSEERLPADIVAPCLAHLVNSFSGNSEIASPIESAATPEDSKGTLTSLAPKEAAGTNDDADYTCPW